MAEWAPSPDTPAWLTEKRDSNITNPRRVRLLDEYCFYCGLQLVEIKLELGQSPPDNAKTWDHMIPSARGGKGGENLVPACWGCNTDKGNLTIEEYRLILAYREGLIMDAGHVFQFAGENKKNS